MGTVKTSIALPTLVPLLDDLDQNVRLSAIEAIGEIPDSEARDILINYGEDANILEQQAVLRALGNFHDKVTEEFLLKMYGSQYLILRIASANALSKFQSDRARDIALWSIATRKYNENEFIPHLSVLAVNKAYEAIPYIIKHYKKMKVSRHRDETLYYLAVIFGIEKDYYREHSKGGDASLRRQINKMFERLMELANIIRDKKLRIKLEEMQKKTLLAMSNSDDMNFEKDYKTILSLIDKNLIEEKKYVLNYFLTKKSLNETEMKFICMAMRSVIKTSVKTLSQKVLLKL